MIDTMFLLKDTEKGAIFLISRQMTFWFKTQDSQQIVQLSH